MSRDKLDVNIVTVDIPVLDQDHKEIGRAKRNMFELCAVHAWVDHNGTAWLPPTAYSYAMLCRTRNRWEEYNRKLEEDFTKLGELAQYLEDGNFYSDHDLSNELLGVLKKHIATMTDGK